MVKILSIFVAFLENMNFNSQIFLKLVQRQLGLNCKNQLFWVLGFRLVPNGQKPAGFARFGDNNYALFKSATCWSGKKVRTKVFNWSEVHLYHQLLTKSIFPTHKWVYNFWPAKILCTCASGYYSFKHHIGSGQQQKIWAKSSKP